MSIIKRGDVWYAVIKVNGKNVKRAAGATRATAQALEVKMKRELIEARERENLGLPAQAPTAPTLSEWLDCYLAMPKVRAAKDIRRVRGRATELKESLGMLKLTAITHTIARAYQSERIKDKKAPATINRSIALLKRALSVAVQTGVIQTNPLQRFVMLQEDNLRSPTLSSTEEATLFAKAPQWLHPVLAIALGTGAREGEINSLEWKDVDLNARIITFKTLKSGDGRSRQLPISEVLAKYLIPLVRPDGFVIMRNGVHPRNESISETFKRTVRKMGRGDLRFHDLRHIAAGRLHASGAGAFDLQAYLGHKTLIVTRRYTVDSVPRLRGFVETAEIAKAEQAKAEKEKRDRENPTT